MPTIAESLPNQSQLKAGLAAGVNSLSQDQVVKFDKYQRVVLPADGFVFYLKTGKSIEFAGSLHYATVTNQREDETISINSVVFTALEEIQDLNAMDPQTLWLATLVDGIRFSFSTRGSYYQQADLHHYRGDAVYPAMESQIIDSAADLDVDAVVVSNSLPVWLTLNAIMPVYPSYLVPANLTPPYAAIHVEPRSTRAIQAAPSFDMSGTHWQLVSDHVRVTIYGMRNNDALDYQDYIFQYSVDYDVIGIMNMPVIQDEKRTQSELSTLAIKKSIEFDISYYQNRVNDVSRQFILDALATYLPNSL